MSRLPFPKTVLHQHIATLGKTGAGKSSVMRVIVEDLLDQHKRVCVIDPKGDWWGLKSSADGKSPGYPVICFGSFKEERASDVPINEYSGRHVAELIATGNRPCIIGLRGWMPSQLTKFWLEFAPTLFNTNQGELYLAIDEIQNFAPKGKIFDPDAGKCLHWTNRMMAEGRGLGLTFYIASQRPQKVHNDTLDCCETLIAMRVAHPAARQALKEWIDGNGDKERGTEVLNTLAQLQRGEAWVWSPENGFGPKRVQFPMFSTFDSFAPPQLQKRVINAGWASVDLDQVREKLSTVIAEAKANDPKELKNEITKLRSQVHQLQAANQHVATAPPSKEQIERASAAAVRTATGNLTRQLTDVRHKAKAIENEATQATRHLGNLMAGITVIAGLEILQVVSPPSTPPAAARTTPTRPAPAAKITPGERKILAAAVQFNGVDKDELGTLTGYKSTARGEYINRLIRKGLAEKRTDGKLYSTAAGREELGSDFEALPTGHALYEWWKQRLPPGELKILSHLVESATGQDVSKDELEAAVGYKSTARNEYINRLARRRLVVKGSGTVKASESLFG